MRKTEFYEAAVRQGFYGLEAGGLFGKKDNVRKYWEDLFIKLSLRNVVSLLLEHKDKIRIVDLGSGSGEGFELLTHIPMGSEVAALERNFILSADQVAHCVGLDISPAMVDQGRKNYADRPNVTFQQVDLSEGFPLAAEEPFDLYFSSYSSLSHLTASALAHVTRQIIAHARGTAYLVYDMFGRFSPEWPLYWSRTCDETLPYNMAYLLAPAERTPDRIENFPVTYWSAAKLDALVSEAARAAGKHAAVLAMQDRSILVGRHTDTGLFNQNPNRMRHAVNCLFDWDYRGDTTHLGVDLAYLDAYRPVQPQAWERIHQYHQDWMTVVQTYTALAGSDNALVKRLIEESRPDLSEELKMLAWIFRNAARFPVVDFWANVMGPQVACVLRNLEFLLPRGLGCGHGLLCVVEITDKL